MTLALLCSGQGRLDPGMFAPFEGAAAAQPSFAAAAALLGEDPRALAHAGNVETLNRNRTSQIMCVTQALAAGACLGPSLPPRVLIAGYSVGEMAAWGLAGLWSPAVTLALTARRAELMDAAGGPDGGLGFVRGLPRADVAALAARHACTIAIVNPAALFIVGGNRVHVARLCDEAMALGAASARPIPVGVASHTPYMTGAVAPFAQTLSTQGGSRPAPGWTLLGAADLAIVRDVEHHALGLAAQLARPIDWAAMLDALVERGATRMLELGPGRALADMALAAFPHLEIRALSDFKTIDGAISWCR